MKPICRECKGNCEPSKVIVNYHNIQTQDLSKEFETVIKDCLKCEDCGHSFIIENNDFDLFEKYEPLPQEVKDIINEFSENDNTYESCAELVKKLESVGYTCDYYLDAEPFNLKKL